MSVADRRAITSLVILYYIAEKYSGIFKADYRIFINAVIRAYNVQLGENERNLLRNRLNDIDIEIDALQLESSITLTLAMGVMIAEHFLQYVGGEKQRAWTLLHEFCNTNQLTRHTLRNKAVHTELDKSDTICNIILGVK